MTKFQKAEFNWHGGYLTYGQYPTPHADRIFIGRFKYANAGKCARHLRDWLIKNMTVEEYRQLRDTPSDWREPSPLDLRMKALGYLQYNLGQACKLSGFPATMQGYADLVAAEARARDNKAEGLGHVGI